MNATTSKATRGLILVGAMLLTLAIGVLLLASQCDRRVGDETDFPLFVAVGTAACGASVLVD